MQFRDINHNLKENGSIPEEVLHFFSKEKNCQVNHLQNYFPLIDFISRKKNPNYHKNIELEIWQLKYNIVKIESNDLNNKKNLPPYSPKTKLFEGIVQNIDTKELHTQPIFIKFTHVLDPHALVRNEYPELSSGCLLASQQLHKLYHKLSFPFNTAYVDSLASYITSNLVENKTCPHFPHVYGIYHGSAKNHCVEFTEEYRDYCRTRTFKEGLHKKYCILKDRNIGKDTSDDDEIADVQSLLKDIQKSLVLDSNKNKEEFDNEKNTDEDANGDGGGDEDEDADADADADADEGMERDTDADEGMESDADADVDADEGMESDESSSSNLLDLDNLELMDLPSRFHSDDDEDSNDIQQYCYLQLYNTPVQIVAMEAFSKTLDCELKSDYKKLTDLQTLTNLDSSYSLKNCYNRWRWYTKRNVFEKKWVALLLQVCLALVSIQHCCNMIHNDLHTQNIMLSQTTKPFLYYKSYSHYYKVPTYGYIIKIIDMGRTTFDISNTPFIGDVFKRHSEAGEQYSYPHSHYRNTSQEVKPNKGFDLARLACSILDEIYTYGNKPAETSSTPIYKGQCRTDSILFNLLSEWITDKYGKPINRFQNFDLYKMLARRMTCTAPLYQLRQPHFASYRITKSEYNIANADSTQDCYYLTPSPSKDVPKKNKVFNNNNNNNNNINLSDDSEDEIFNQTSSEDEYKPRFLNINEQSISHVTDLNDLNILHQ